MSALVRGGGYGHHVQRVPPHCYRISWSYDVRYGRLRYPRTLSRITDHAGAVRFATKWGLLVPDPEPEADW